jgi:bifunctional UDP-N-acetylglucosamine pyrophosphorylase/glucosamine-1-phosphate N-acetyltransferase
MQFVVLAAGRGRRLSPLTDVVPKPMLPVGQKPLLGHVADAALEAGAGELLFVVPSDDDSAQTHFGDRYRGVPITYVVQHEANGTAGAVSCAAEHLEGPFVVLNGDNLYDGAALAEVTRRAPAIGVHRVSDPREYGVVSRNGDTVTGLVEKPAYPPTNLANVGAYALPSLEPDAFDVSTSDRGEREFTDVVSAVIDEYDVTPVEFDRWLDVGRPWELLRANELEIQAAERSIDGTVHRDAHLRGAVVVESGAEIRERTTIEGPALVRSGARVGPGAYVRGISYVGENVDVGHGVEVKNSVVMADTSVGHLSYVGDSVLGRDVNLGAGTTIANLRHDERPIELTVQGERTSTGRRKFGAVVGHGAKTGINTSVYPGVTLSTGSTTRPGETIEEDR